MISGDVYEFTSYEKGYLSEYKGNKGSGRLCNGEKSDDYDNNVEKNLKRTRRKIRNLVNSNIQKNSKFITLTFRENITDVDFALMEFQKFIKRVNYKIFNTKKSKFQYLQVYEFQKRGAIHFHVIGFNLPYISNSVLADLWKCGFVKINKIDDVDNVGAYVCKYLSKSLKDDLCKSSDDKINRCFSYSRNLKKSIEITDKKKIEQLLSTLSSENVVYSSVYDNDYTGRTSYIQFNKKSAKKQ